MSADRLQPPDIKNSVLSAPYELASYLGYGGKISYLVADEPYSREETVLRSNIVLQTNEGLLDPVQFLNQFAATSEHLATLLTNTEDYPAIPLDTLGILPRNFEKLFIDSFTPEQTQLQMERKQFIEAHIDSIRKVENLLFTQENLRIVKETNRLLRTRTAGQYTGSGTAKAYLLDILPRSIALSGESYELTERPNSLFIKMANGKNLRPHTVWALTPEAISLVESTL